MNRNLTQCLVSVFALWMLVQVVNAQMSTRIPGGGISGGFGGGAAGFPGLGGFQSMQRDIQAVQDFQKTVQDFQRTLQPLNLLTGSRYSDFFRIVDTPLKGLLSRWPERCDGIVENPLCRFPDPLKEARNSGLLPKGASGELTEVRNDTSEPIALGSDLILGPYSVIDKKDGLRSGWAIVNCLKIFKTKRRENTCGYQIAISYAGETVYLGPYARLAEDGTIESGYIVVDSERYETASANSPSPEIRQTYTPLSVTSRIPVASFSSSNRPFVPQRGPSISRKGKIAAVVLLLGLTAGTAYVAVKYGPESSGGSSSRSSMLPGFGSFNPSSIYSPPITPPVGIPGFGRP